MARFSFTEEHSGGALALSSLGTRAPLVDPSSDRPPPRSFMISRTDFDFGPNGPPKKSQFRSLDFSLTGAIRPKL